jgi:hypothetical protein
MNRLPDWSKPILLFLFVFVLLILLGMLPSVAHGKTYPLHPPKGYPAMSRAAIRAAVDSALAEDGVSPAEHGAWHFIQSRECVRNLAHPGGSRKRHENGLMYGIAQLNRAKARSCAWWNPHEATHRAIRYMRSRSYGRFGRGIIGAYRHKRAHGTY